VLESRFSEGTVMGTFRPAHTFDPLDLEIIERVYEAAWAKIESRYLYRDTNRDDERQKALRRWLFVLAKSPVDFDMLYDKVEASLPKTWAADPDGQTFASHVVETGQQKSAH
jgi:hypothetical protein